MNLVRFPELAGAPGITHCVRPLLSVVELGLVCAWVSVSCMWVKGSIGLRSAPTLLCADREHIQTLQTCRAKVEGCLVGDGWSISPYCLPRRWLLPVLFAAASEPGFACSSQRSSRQHTPSPPSVRWLRHVGKKGSKQIQKSTDRE